MDRQLLWLRIYIVRFAKVMGNCHTTLALQYPSARNAHPRASGLGPPCCCTKYSVLITRCDNAMKCSDSQRFISIRVEKIAHHKKCEVRFQLMNYEDKHKKATHQVFLDASFLNATRVSFFRKIVHSSFVVLWRIC